jgi:hypothetical protein
MYEKYRENKKRVKGVHDDRRRPSTEKKDINRPEVFIMLEGLIETQQIGEGFTRYISSRRTSRDRILLKRVFT